MPRAAVCVWVRPPRVFCRAREIYLKGVGRIIKEGPRDSAVVPAERAAFVGSPVRLVSLLKAEK